MENSFIVVAHNIRSAYNVGSIFRTADGAGVDEIYLSGYSPHPPDSMRVHMTQAHKMLVKTALGAEKSVSWKKVRSIGNVIDNLRKNGYQIVALEQSDESVDYRKFRPGKRTALIVGNEPRGVDRRILKKCDAVIEIPMRGKKDSLNVSVAFGIAAYELCSKIKRDIF